MSCGHGWHGCGPWYGPPNSRGWYEPADWYEEAPEFRPRRRYRRYEREASAGELEAQLAGLRDEVRRLETELTELHRQEEAAAEGP